uniref:Rhodanese domain-containing protein n=1 Tax=Kalanchoe fedtschenkoi TaxID=63787 RepID=A0A7N0T3E2_KALFE
MAVQLNNSPNSVISLHPKRSCRTISHRANAVSLVKAASSNGLQLIKSGKLRPVVPKEAEAIIESEGFVLLDVRPTWEREKAHVAGTPHVPLFLKDEDSSPLTLLKKWVHFGYIGCWTGQQFTTINQDFVQQVEKVIPDKTSKVLVACGEGLRSLMAASRLHECGYRNLGWLAGGFNRAGDGDFKTIEGEEKLQYAAIGGASYYFLKVLIFLQAVGRN